MIGPDRCSYWLVDGKGHDDWLLRDRPETHLAGILRREYRGWSPQNGLTTIMTVLDLCI